MNLKNFYKIIKKNIKFIAVFTAAVIILAEAFVWYTSGGYDVSLSLFVFSKVNQPTQDYQYDGYYSVKAADEFSNTVQQWTKSQEIVNETYQKAGVERPTNSLQAFYRTIKAQKLAPQYVDVRFNVAEEAQAGKMAKALAGVLQEKADLAGKYSGNVVFTIIGGEPVVAKNSPSFILYGLLALIGGFLISTLLILLKEDDNRH